MMDEPGLTHPQLQSPLFSKLPPELRYATWAFVLTLYEDAEHPYDIRESSTRPGHAAPKRIALDLLLTCRTVYIETFLLPFQLNALTLYPEDPESLLPNPLQIRVPKVSPLHHRLARGKKGILEGQLRLKPWQFANITSVDWHVAPHEDSDASDPGLRVSIADLCGAESRSGGDEFRSDFAWYPTTAGLDPSRNFFIGQKLKSLTINFNRFTWRSWALSSEIDDTCGHRCTLLSEARVCSPADSTMAPSPWATRISTEWPDLERLTFIFETFAANHDVLGQVIHRAKLWVFPLRGGYELRWNGHPESNVLWQGADKYHCCRGIGRRVHHLTSYGWAYDTPVIRDGQGDIVPISKWVDEEKTGLRLSGLDARQRFITKTLVFKRGKADGSRDPRLLLGE
ncbi:hypothetical protein F4780DRAFT_341562 [Xylariomycetidae sp. FL0641]|nr:hypothetical protein F4780DRAFT_341562 [Xylariomycetidae sp. FL0641]